MFASKSTSFTPADRHFVSRFSILDRALAEHPDLLARAMKGVIDLKGSIPDGFGGTRDTESTALDSMDHVRQMSPLWRSQAQQALGLTRGNDRKNLTNLLYSFSDYKNSYLNFSVFLFLTRPILQGLGVNILSLEEIMRAAVLKAEQTEYRTPMPYLVNGELSLPLMGLLQFFDFRGIGMTIQKQDFDGIKAVYDIDFPAHDWFHLFLDGLRFSGVDAGLRRFIGITLFLLTSGNFYHGQPDSRFVKFFDNAFESGYGLSDFNISSQSPLMFKSDVFTEINKILDLLPGDEKLTLLKVLHAFAQELLSPKDYSYFSVANPLPMMGDNMADLHTLKKVIYDRIFEIDPRFTGKKQLGTYIINRY